MCGITGIWQIDRRPVIPGTIHRFTEALAHRGPDGEGFAFEDGASLALGHRRLAVLDLSDAGAQPMVSPSGRYVITYNGEIYNFVEIRGRLEQHDLRLRTNTDTEVILAAFERWGTDCLPLFNGMWSFALWDRHERRLLLSRDRFGVKPMYVAMNGRRLAFASELKAFLHLDGFHAGENTKALRARLDGDRADHVLLEGVEALPAGHCLEVTRERTRRWRWWNTLDHLRPVPADPTEQAEDFRRIVFDACALRARADVPLASAVSGGLDSTAVLCSFAAVQARGAIERNSPDWRRAYVASFPGTTQDETEHGKTAARHAGARALVHRFSGGDVRDHLDAYLYQYEEIGSLYGISSWLLYGAMRRDGVVVSLDGHGGDELLAGYGLHLLLALLRGPRLTRDPRRANDLIRTLHGMFRAGYPDQPGGWLRLAALTYPEIRAIARRVLPSQRTLDESLRRHSLDPSSEDSEAFERLGPLTGVLYQSFHRESLPRILRNFDAYSMGHGVEVRMPLLDWNLVCYAFSTPDEAKASNGYSKRLLRAAMRGVVPEPLRRRRDKLGFTAPVSDWLRSGLSGWLWEEVNDPDFLRSELWDGPSLHALARAKRASGEPWSHDDAHRITMAVAANWWRTRWFGRR
jgi:asparagine synthase (glutamine-hydrolysing)